MLGTTMIVMGMILAVGSIVAGYYLISVGCATGAASGCQAGAIELISGLMISNEGIFFWLAWVGGIFLIWGGVRVKARA
ncbi:hypothetical protein H0A73_05075 [Alcaligenaceae bacterium]|nr:hypothetical protein [Alcaligenaceae bacterium]